MNIVERLKAWITLIEAVLLKPQDTTQLDSWIEEAEDLTEGLGFEEEDGQMIDEVLDGYERLFQEQFLAVAANTLSTVASDLLEKLLPMGNAYSS